MGKMKRLTHIDSDGRAQMVDVSAKPLSKRRAVARGNIRLQRETLDLITRDHKKSEDTVLKTRLKLV